MKYSKINDIHIVEIPVTDFKIVMNDSKKKTAHKDNYCNAGFFATYHENKQPFTLPVGHLRCDYKATSAHTKKYCKERGRFAGDKFTFDSSQWSYMNPCFNKPISTLLVKDFQAEIKDVINVTDEYNYAITGIPIMRNGNDVKFNTYVKEQGWNGSELYATWHMFIGLKYRQGDVIYVMAMKTKTKNMVLTAEAFKKFKDLGFYDVIKLDGGGSAFMKVNNKAVVSTSENRRVNSIILFGGPEKTTVTTNNNKVTNSNCPYSEPTKTVKKSILYNKDALWVQWILQRIGLYTDKIDGKFGKLTKESVIAFQKKYNLTPDGVVGPITRGVMKTLV